jgi:hypothetical protein
MLQNQLNYFQVWILGLQMVSQFGSRAETLIWPGSFFLENTNEK